MVGGPIFSWRFWPYFQSALTELIKRAAAGEGEARTRLRYQLLAASSDWPLTISRQTVYQYLRSSIGSPTAPSPKSKISDTDR